MPDTPENTHDDQKRQYEFEKLRFEVKKLKHSLMREQQAHRKEKLILNKIQKNLPSITTFLVSITGIIGLYITIDKYIYEKKIQNELSISTELIELTKTIQTLPEHSDFDQIIYIQIATYDLKILPLLIDTYVGLSLNQNPNKKKELIKLIKFIQFNKQGNIKSVEEIIETRWLNYIEVCADRVEPKLVISYFRLSKEILFLNKISMLKEKFKADLSKFMAQTQDRENLLKLIDDEE